MLTKNHILIKLNELKPTLYENYSVIEIGLFGSFSNGNYTDDSDIALLVELEKPIGWKFFFLETFLGKVFGRNVDVVTKNALKEQIKENILQLVNYV